jgi:SNF2 family DNA or RNA helicase
MTTGLTNLTPIKNGETVSTPAMSNVPSTERRWTVSTLAMPKTASRKSLEPWIFDSVEYYPHQVDGIRELARWKNFLLADDMGLGKSLQAMTVFAIDVVRGWAETCIVVCPVTLKGNWQDELEKFTSFPHTVLTGSPAARNKQLLEFASMTGPRVLIVNYEQVKPHLDALNKMKFDVKILDEAHYIKNYKSVRTKACLDLRSKRSFLLTGTPMLNHVNELWPLLNIIDPNGYPKYWNFVQRYCVFGGFKDKQIVGTKNEKELKERLHGIMLRRLKKDVLDLPEVQILPRRVDLSPEQRKLYDEVVTDMRLPAVDDAEPEDIENALTKFLRLKQICGTTFTFTNNDISSKLDLAVEDDLQLLENDERVVVFTQFLDVMDCYTDRMKKQGAMVWKINGSVKQPDRVPVIRQWESSEPGILICMLQIAREGLNLVAARHGAFLDELFVPGLNQQAIDRLHRIGQDKTQPVQIRKYICRNTIENRIQQILRTKSKLFGEIVETDPDWKRKIYRAIMEDDE